MTESAGGPAIAREPPLAGDMDRLLACVHCGFCLDACPTYTRGGLENDSPRGRLYLMRAVAEGRISAGSDAFGLHLDRCLGCRACEPVCPSGVEYGFLLERSREAIANARGTAVITRALLRVFGSRTLNAAVGVVGRLLRRTGLAAGLLRLTPSRFSRTRFALAMLIASKPWSGLGRAGHGAAGGRSDAVPTDSPGIDDREVATLRGCVQDTLFRRVNIATDHVLQANGYRTLEVPGQGCCGALHAHAGDLDGARALARANISAFERAGSPIVVVNSAGCGAMMKEYGRLFEGRSEHDRAAGLARRVVDPAELLDREPVRRGAPLSLGIAWDAPCHLIHGQRIADAPLNALRNAIPDLYITRVAGFDECCGGAGIHGLTHQAPGGGRVLEDKLDAVRAAAADAIVTANPGCMMQIGAGLVLAGDRTPVLHPMELIAESYRRAGIGQGRTRERTDR